MHIYILHFTVYVFILNITLKLTLFTSLYIFSFLFLAAQSSSRRLVVGRLIAWFCWSVGNLDNQLDVLWAAFCDSCNVLGNNRTNTTKYVSKKAKTDLKKALKIKQQKNHIDISGHPPPTLINISKCYNIIVK